MKMDMGRERNEGRKVAESRNKIFPRGINIRDCCFSNGSRRYLEAYCLPCAYLISVILTLPSNETTVSRM